MANTWTADGGRALRVAQRISAGRIAINGGGEITLARVTLHPLLGSVCVSSTGRGRL